jgi:hypothetical protein
LRLFSFDFEDVVDFDGAELGTRGVFDAFLTGRAFFGGSI